MASKHQLFQMLPWDGGINTALDASMIPPNQLVQADNAVFATRASRKKREGINFDWDDQSNDTHAIIGQHDFWMGAATKTQTRVAINDNKEFYKYSSSGARTDITVDEGVTAWLSNITLASFLTFNNRLLIAVDGSGNHPRIWDGSGNIKDLGKFEVSKVTTVADTSASLDATYFLVYDDEGAVAFWIDVDDDGATEPAHGAARAVKITTITSDMTASEVAAEVKAAVDADTKFTATVDSNVVTITSTTAGAKAPVAAGTSGFTVAVVEEGNDTPKASFFREHLGRVWCNDKANRDRLHYSTTADETEWNGIGDSGALDIGIGDGDPEGITNAFVFKGVLFVAKKTKLYKVLGDAPENFQVILVSNGIGCVSPSYASVDESDVVFISERGFHSIAATEAYGDFEAAYLSKDIQPSFNDEFVFTRLKYIQAVYVPNLNSVAFTVTEDGASSNNNLWFYNIERKAWYRWPDISCQSICLFRDSDKVRLYIGTGTNRLAKTENGTNYDIDTSGNNTAIMFRIKTGLIFPDEAPYLVKGFKKFVLIYRPQGPHSITCTIKIDNYEDQAITFSQTGSTDLLGSTFILGSSTLGYSSVVLPYTQPIDGYGRGFQLVVEQSGIQQEVEIQGFAVEYKPAGTQQEVNI